MVWSAAFRTYFYSSSWWLVSIRILIRKVTFFLSFTTWSIVYRWEIEFILEKGIVSSLSSRTKIIFFLPFIFDQNIQGTSNALRAKVDSLLVSTSYSDTQIATSMFPKSSLHKSHFAISYHYLWTKFDPRKNNFFRSSAIPVNQFPNIY